MKKHLSRRRLIIGAVIVGVLIVGGIVWYVEANQAPSFGSAAVTRGNVVETVNAPATVLAENNANLSFEESGQIASVNVQEGQQVSAGQTLITLDHSSLNASLQEANAAVVAAQAQLSQLQTGTRPEQLAVDQTAVTNAQASLSADVQNAYIAAADAVQNETDNLFTNPNTANPQFNVTEANSQSSNDIQMERVMIGSTLDNWYAAVSASSTFDPTTALQQIQAYLDQIAIAVNGATPNTTMTASTLAGYKADVVAARSEVGAAVTTLTSAESTLANAQSQLALAQAGSTPQQIAAQQAAVEQAEAAQTAAQVAFDNATLVAPFAGTVQNLTAQVGQVVAPGTQVLSLVNNSGLKIQAYVSETDVGKIKAGDAANITLDAYGNGVTFPATITTVDNSETQVNGAPAYQVTLHFTQADPRLKDGLTGNANIVAAEDDNVIEVPTNLVITNGSSTFVLIQQNGATVQQPVQVGINGDNGMTEITSGLNVGDQLTNF